jgi:hypothetical protein
MQLVGVAYAKMQVVEKSSCKNSVNGWRFLQKFSYWMKSYALFQAVGDTIRKNHPQLANIT